MAKLELVGVEKHFGPVRAVGPVDLEVREGEFLCLLGPSGCGKTTTLRIVAGLEWPTVGDLRLDGRSVADVPPHRRDVGMVFQNYALFSHLSVFENVAFGLRLRKKGRQEIKDTVERSVAVVGLIGYEGRMPSQLSGGQQQRVALARAVAIEPSILLLDEPLSNLDLKLREQTRLEIYKIQRRLGITTIYVTHDQIEALSMSDRIVVMNKGRVEQVGTPTEIYERPQSRFVADFIGRANIMKGRVIHSDNGTALVDLGGVRPLPIPRELFGEIPEDHEAEVVVRPEKIGLTKQAIGSACSLQGLITGVLYEGERWIFSVDVQGQGEILVSRPSRGEANEFREGEEVHLEIPAEACRFPGRHKKG